MTAWIPDHSWVTMTTSTVLSTATVDKQVLMKTNPSLFTMFYQELRGQKGMLENQLLYGQLYALFTLVPYNIQEPRKILSPYNTRKC